MNYDTIDTTDAINANLALIDKYIKSDPRLEEHKDLLQRSLSTLTFEKLIHTNAGVRKIHYIDYNGSQVPMRLLSLKEEREIKCATLREFKKYPEFIGGEDHPEFSRLQLIKTLSKVTDASPETNKPHFTESEVEDMPSVAFNYLIREYRKLELKYNLEYNPNMEDDISTLLQFIFDGAPLNEKKYHLLSGLSSSMLLQITIRLCRSFIKLEDNAQFITSLNDMNQNETDEN